MYDFACIYTHAQSNLAKSCLKGNLVSQIRAVVLASYGNKSLKVGLSKLVGKFRKTGYKISGTEVFALTEHHKRALPISY